MEGVGARLGRSSTRYGPATVFSGPVRKWKKKWIHVAPPSGSGGASSNNHNSRTSAAANGSNGNTGSHILLYKWMPISQSADDGGNSNGEKRSVKDDGDGTAAEEPPQRKFKYIPIAVLEEQKSEMAEEVEEVEDKPGDTDPSPAEQTSNSNGFNEKPDINDVPIEESQAQENNNQVERQDLNLSTLELSLGTEARDGKLDS